MTNTEASERISGEKLWIGKLAPPELPTDAVPRTRIVEELSRCDVPIVLVVAPAGFGKTSLMRQAFDDCLAFGTPVAWLTLNRRDNDLRRFLNYLSATLSPFITFPDRPSLAASNPGVVYGATRDEAAPILDAITLSSVGFTLFIDEFECLTSPEVVRTIQELVLALNPGQRVIIGSRSMKLMPLTSLSLQGRVKKILADHLRFDDDETAQFFSRQSCLSLSEQDISLVKRRVEGWPAGLRLVSLALPRISEPTAWLEDLSGRMDGFADYLAENVLAHLGEKEQDFILRASALDRLSGSLCDSVLERSDSAQILSELYRANLFLTPVGNGSEWFGFHPLFHEFLYDHLKRTAPAAIARLHRRAALWYLGEQRFPPAVDYALVSGDHDLAVTIIEQCAMDFVAASQLDTVASWLDQIPSAVIENKERIQNARAYAMTSLHRFDDARDALTRLRCIAAAEGRTVPPQVDLQMALINEWTDRNELTEAELAKAENRISADDGLQFGICQNIKANLAIMAGRFDAARQAVSSAKSAYQRAQLGRWSFTYTLCFEGVIDMIQGNARDATQRFETAWRDADGVGRELAGCYLADALYERDDLIRAGGLAEENMRSIRTSGSPDAIIVGFRAAARAAFLLGRKEFAESTLTELGDIGDMLSVPRLKVAAWLEKSRLALFSGDSEAAARYVRLAVSNQKWKIPELTVRYPLEIEDPDIAAIRLDLIMGKAGDAASRLETAIRGADQTTRGWRKLRLKVLLAQAYACMRKRGPALRLIEDALLAGGRNDFVRVFADEPWFLPDLIEEVASRAPHISRRYMERIQAATRLIEFRQDEIVLEKVNVEFLTVKEREIMYLVAEGRSNKEIARQLAITDNTVETHLRNINQKLGTKKRTEAVAKLRELGILR